MITREDMGRLVPGTVLVGVQGSGVSAKETRFRVERSVNSGGSIQLCLVELATDKRVVCFAYTSGANLVFYTGQARMEEFWHAEARIEGSPKGLGGLLV
ncbi:MAG: hypothetical protein HYY51_02445 [Candidatus Magasanikbacteria bacterium]|nr:hypothetical protein [Candidatus Magasanikbacteria bacterium]